LTTNAPEPAAPWRRFLAELIGTALLLIAVVGSGIMAQRLSPHDVGLQLLENSIATAAALVAIILAFGPISGAHLNPVVTLADRLFGALTTGQAAGYIAAQLAGGAVGSVIANLMFALPAIEWSAKTRGTPGLWLGEVVATYGLLLVIFGVVRSKRTSVVPFAVAGYIGAAYWFTSSTSFANPAASVARMLTDTFAGIAPRSAPGFILAEMVGAALAVFTISALYPRPRATAPDVVLPHEQEPASPDGRHQQQAQR
jgi:glycerol uptake facilitator-like aquaporin